MSDVLSRAAHADDAIPESFRDLPSFGPYALLWAIGWLTLAAQRRGPYDGALLLLVALVVPLGLSFHVWNLARHGGPPRELARVAFWPPEWWGMWWPRGLRRPGDVWRRLPPPAQATRVVLSIFCIALPALVLLHTPTAWKMALIFATAVALGGAMLWARRHELDWSDAVRVLFGATTPSPIWSEPEIARLLASNDRVRAPDAASAADHRRAIAELAALLPGDAGALRSEVPRLAQRLLSAIDECSLESAALARDANAAEVDRLEAQLSALESEPARGGGERHELVALVRRQLELVRGMRVRAELVSQRRARLFALMRGLWAQLRIVAGLASERPDHAAEFARLSALRDEIEAELSTT